MGTTTENAKTKDFTFDGQNEYDVVLNVDMFFETCKFDLLKFDVDGNLSYSSKSYHLYDHSNSYVGLFELFDDIFQKRLIFFNSSRSVQKFLLSLDKSEIVFSEKTGRNFLDFYTEIRNSAVNAVNMKSSFSNPMTEPISSGYGIEMESKDTRDILSFLMSMFDCSQIINGIIEQFNFGKWVETKTGNYIFIDMTDSSNPSMFIDSVVNMPLLVHYFDYAIRYMENLLIPYSKSGIFGKDVPIKVRIYDLDNNVTLGEILDLCDEDGIISDFSKDVFKGNFVEMTIDKEYCEGKFLSSIIGH